MPGKIDHELHDCCLSSLAMMFFQDPSINQFQKRLHRAVHKNNLQTLFDVKSIPKETQMRAVVDSIPSTELEPLFADLFKPLQRGKLLEQFTIFNGGYFVPIDATQYFSSDKINCSKCLHKKHRDGKIVYSHQALAAAIVCPGMKQVFPLAPEPIQNTDGATKQDCEINAGKRLLKKIRSTHPKLKITIGGDGLYSKQPFINELKANNMSFILVAKQSDHKNLHQWFAETRALKETHTLKIKDFNGRDHVYEWLNDIPLNDTKNADNVNFFQYSMFKGKKRTFRSSWVTDIQITSKNIKELVKCGRARWKIENETFNTLKNQGYHAEHNYGHGKQYLAYNFFLMNLLAFYMHQIFQNSCKHYQNCRTEFTAYKEFWNNLRSIIRHFVFSDWEGLLDYVADPPGAPP
ncbi:MAG: transposase [Desulfobacterales bacterium]|nr:transposase [Desulfobacterales bacterium]